jgi:hypothetical protein
VSVTFSRWVEAVFDHPVGGPEWYWGEEFDSFWDSLGLSDEVTVAYLTQLFRDPRPLQEYALDQVAQGLWFLIGEASPAQPSYALLRSGVSLEERMQCVRSIAAFFHNFVAPLAHGPAEPDSNAFHCACYMWWDIFPSWGNPQSGEAELHEACLNTMAEILASPSELCQLSALHGLNHWHLHYPAAVEAVVDRFVRERTGITTRISSYASAARLGRAQ